MEEKVDRLEEGICNFKEHTRMVNAFIARSDTREEEGRKYQDQREKSFARYVLLIGCIPVLLEIMRIMHVIPKP